MLEWSFLLKKVIAAFCMPLPISIFLVMLAMFLFWRKRFLFAKITSVLSLGFLYLISIQATGNLLASNLEYQYPQYQKSLLNKNLDYVLVLGGGHASDDRQPISSLLSTASLSRLVEGIRAYRLNPGSKLLLSGYSSGDGMSHAQALKNVALHFGVTLNDIVLAEHVKDTQEEAKHWMNFAKGKSLALVTSASHMPRAMFLFNNVRRQAQIKGVLIPAPTDYISNSRKKGSWRSWFPSGQNIYRLDRAWHEYLGLLWAKLVA